MKKAALRADWKQVIFRLWDSDNYKMKKRIATMRINRQQVLEALTVAWLEGDKHLDSIVTDWCNSERGKRRHELLGQDTELLKLYKEIEKNSPLADLGF